MPALGRRPRHVELPWTHITACSSDCEVLFSKQKTGALVVGTGRCPEALYAVVATLFCDEVYKLALEYKHELQTPELQVLMSGGDRTAPLNCLRPGIQKWSWSWPHSYLDVLQQTPIDRPGLCASHVLPRSIVQCVRSEDISVLPRGRFVRLPRFVSTEFRE